MYVCVRLSTRYSNRILRIIEFRLQISNNSQIPYFMKIRPVKPSCSILTKRHDEGNSYFFQFCEIACQLDSLYYSNIHQYTQIKKPFRKFRGKRK
jgi:hypothetical protein